MILNKNSWNGNIVQIKGKNKTFTGRLFKDQLVDDDFTQFHEFRRPLPADDVTVFHELFFYLLRALIGCL